MNIILATTWYPRGELTRFTRLLPILMEHYCGLVIACVMPSDPTFVEQFTSGQFSAYPGLTFFVNEARQMGRHLALKRACECSSGHVHYADMDRLLRWVETRPEEWLQALDQIEKHDCIIFGRTEAAYSTHPQALITTEKLSNQVISHFMGCEVDFCAGSKSFSHSAAQYLAEHGRPDDSVGTDAEWPIRLKQAGYQVEYIEVDGLDWESADQYRDRAASAEEQQRAAEQYDADVQHWAHRVEIAGQVIQSATMAAQINPSAVIHDSSPSQEFDFDAVFNPEDYLYFYAEHLTDERTDAEVSALVSLLELGTRKEILDLACGFGRHANRLAALGHSVTGVDRMPGFLEIAKQDAQRREVNVRYLQADMRKIHFEQEFDLAMILFTAFGYFPDEENLQVLVNVREALKPGGRLIFDSMNRDALYKDFRPFFVVEKDGNLMIDRMSFDSLQGRFYNKRIMIKSGVRKDMPYFVRLYNSNEIKSLLSQAGLELQYIYAGWDGKEMSSDSHRMVVIARRPE